MARARGRAGAVALAVGVVLLASACGSSSSSQDDRAAASGGDSQPRTEQSADVPAATAGPAQRVGVPPPHGVCALNAETAAEILGEPVKNEGWAYPHCVFTPSTVAGLATPEYLSVGENAAVDKPVTEWRQARHDNGFECGTIVDRPELGAGAYEEYCPVSEELGAGQSAHLYLPNGNGMWSLDVSLHMARMTSETAAVDLLHHAYEVLNASPDSGGLTPAEEGSSNGMGDTDAGICPDAAEITELAGTEMVAAQATETGKVPEVGCQYNGSERGYTFMISAGKDAESVKFLRNATGSDAEDPEGTFFVAEDSGSGWGFRATANRFEVDAESGAVMGFGTAWALTDDYICFSSAAMTVQDRPGEPAQDQEVAEALDRLVRAGSELSRSWCADEEALDRATGG